MIDGYCRFNGKHPAEKEEERIYHDEPPKNGDYGASLSLGYTKLDVDDWDHKTGELVEPIRGKPRSEAVQAILDDLGLKYNLMITEHGKHFYLKIPDGLLEKSKKDWYSPVGIKMEWKLGGGTSKEHIPIGIGGVTREFVKGSIDNRDIDFLPTCLYPLQKPKHTPYDLDIVSGDRNNTFSEYLFYLVGKKGYSADDAFTIVRMMNKHVLEEPLGDREMDTILRDETYHKLKAMERQQHDKNISHSDVGDEVVEQFQITTVNNTFYTYQGGVYVPIDQNEINAFIGKKYRGTKINFRREVLEYVKCQTFTKYNSDSDALINVRNGYLNITPNKETRSFDTNLIEHDPQIISFKQFNAEYMPGIEYPLLDEVLNKVFCGDQEMIKLFDELIGYLMMDHTNYAKCFFFVGKPSGGKSKILNMITRFIGKENVSTLSLKDLNDKFRLSGIIHKTANILADLEQTTVTESGIFKSLVTGDGVTVEVKYGQSFTYYNTAKLLFGCNTLPHFVDKGGVMRRPIIIPFDHKFSKDDPDFNPFIDEDLSTPECMSALLNRGIEGYKRLTINGGFSEPPSVQREFEKFKIANSNVLTWIAEVEHDEGSLQREGIGTLFRNFSEWCYRNGCNATGRKAFTEEIKNEYNFSFRQVRLPGSKGERDRFFVK